MATRKRPAKKCNLYGRLCRRFPCQKAGRKGCQRREP